MITSIFEQALMTLPLIMGAYITLSLLKLPDFSIESAYLLGAVAAFLTKDLPLPITLLSALVGGMVVGGVVSTLNQYLRLPFLLAAIITNGLFHGLTQYLLGTSLATFHPLFTLSEIPLFTLVGTCLVGVIGALSRSQLGYSFAIFGNNPLFFSHHGLSSRYVMFSGVMIGHGCAGLGGFLFAQSNGFVDLTMNFGVILLCLTALMLGKLLIRTPRPHILIPLVGILVYFIIQQTLLRMGLNLKYFNSFQALFILIVLSIGHKRHKITLDHLGV